MTKTVEMVFQQDGFGPPAPVEIFQWEAEFNQLLDLYREQKPKRLLEIGTYYGGTLYHWLKNATPGATIVSLDSYVTGVDNRHLYDTWVPDDVNLVVVAADSNNPDTVQTVLEASGNLSFDWVFIDGGHYYAEAKADWEIWKPLAIPGGIVILHDIVTNPEWPWIEVEILWREIQREGYITREIVCDKPDPVCGLGVVYLPRGGHVVVRAQGLRTIVNQ